MKKTIFLLIIALSVLLGMNFLSFNSHAMVPDEKESAVRIAVGAAVATEAEVRSLVFFDAHLGKDNMDFLLQKYGENPAVQAAIRILPSETYDYKLGADDAFVRVTPGKDPAEKCRNFLRNILSSSIYDPENIAHFQGTRLFGEAAISPLDKWRLIQTVYIPLLQEMGPRFSAMFKDLRESQGKPLTHVEETILKLKEKPHQVFHDITYSAYMLDAIRQQYGQAPLLFLGRAGCFLQLACEEFYKFRNSGIAAKDIYHLNFSGTPDIESKRTGGDLSDNSPAVVARHLLTPDRLAFYCNYMDEQGMNQIGDKVYVIDVIATARSANSAVRVFRYYYEEHLKRKKMPDVHFIALCSDLLVDSINGSATNFQDRKTPHWEYNSSAGTILFKETREVGGIRPFKVQVSPLLIDSSTGAITDSDLVESLGVHGIEYPPYKWRPEFNAERARGGKFHKELYDGLRPTMRKVFEVVDKKILKGDKKAA